MNRGIPGAGTFWPADPARVPSPARSGYGAEGRDRTIEEALAELREVLVLVFEAVGRDETGICWVHARALLRLGDGVGGGRRSPEVAELREVLAALVEAVGRPSPAR